MSNRELKKRLTEYFEHSMETEINIAHMEETIKLCVATMREQPAPAEPRQSFWGFLSDVFHFEGISLLSEYAGNKIVILSTHIVSDVEAIADVVLVMNAGKIIQQGAVPELARQVAGSVWELTVPKVLAREWQERVTVANYRHEGDNVVLRIISDEAVACEPTLDDAYLYYFGAEEALR